MSEQHPIEGLMTTAMENLKDMVDVNTIIGDPIESPDGSVIITVSKVGFGFAAGGSEFYSGQGQGDSQDKSQDSQSENLPFGGGSGGGVSITPIAFLVVNNKDVQMIHLNEHTHIYEKMLDLAPQAVEKIQEIIKGNKASEKDNKEGNKQENKEKDGDKEKPKDE